jgi:ATP/maltotriose-dependent transcriptional regulator MalT
VPRAHLERSRRPWVAGATGGDRQAPTASPPRAAAPGLVEPLSGREPEVLRLLAAGQANRQIAAELVVAPDTAKKHVSHVLGKLGAANRTAAVARARELGLLD